MPGSRTTRRARTRRSAARSRTPGACTTCTATSGSGAPTPGTPTTRAPRTTACRASIRTRRSACCAAARGPTTPTAPAAPSAPTSRSTTAATASASAASAPRSRRHRMTVRTSRLALAVALLLAAGADWPQFLGPTRNGSSPETGLLKTWPAKGPPVVWERAVGEGYSGPVVAGGRLVLFHRVGDEEVVECLDAATGKPHWKAATPTAYADSFGKGNGPRSTPLIAGGNVYTLGADGLLQCLSLADGKKLWRRELHKDYEVRKGFFGVATSP